MDYKQTFFLQLCNIGKLNNKNLKLFNIKEYFLFILY